jgi:hypothetical protein
MVLNHYHKNHKTITIYAVDRKIENGVRLYDLIGYRQTGKFDAMCLSVSAMCLSVKYR